MKYSRLLLVSIVCVAVLPVLAQNIPPQTIIQLKTYYPDTTLVDGGKANCIVVYPEEQGYAELAQEVAAAIKAASGADVPLKTDKQYTKADRDTNLICLGRMNNNKLALDLYIFHYIACDDWFPGPGDDEHAPGFVVRSCCDPWGTGKNVIMLGGTELDGVRLAVEHFKGLLQKGDTLVIPRTIKTQFKGIENLDQLVEAEQKYYHEKFIDLKALPYGAEGRMKEVAERYFLTGRDEYPRMYALLMRRWMDEYYKWVPHRQITTPKYAIPDMILSFDQIEESSLIADDLKVELTNLLHSYTSRMSVHGRIRQLKPGVLAPTGHHAVSETVVYGARYFKQYYPDADFERIDRGLASVETGQETISSCYGFIDDDTGYTQSYPTTAMKLALAMDNHDYFTSGAARKWMEYSMNVTNNTRSSFFGPSLSFAIAAWYYQDPTYVWFNKFRKYEKSTYYPEMTADALTYFLWTYLPNIEPRMPEVTGGLHYMVVHPTNYEQMKRMGKFINVPRERTFNQLTMRESFGLKEQYLRLDGINSGIAGGGNGNAIPNFTDGRTWLTSGHWGSSSMKYHPTCLVLRDGQMADKYVALCDLQLASDLPNSAFVRSVMHEYNGLDWARDIIWLKRKYWVVFDHMQVVEPADYSIFCQWRGGPSSVDDEYRATATSRDHTLVIQATGGTRPQVTRDEPGYTVLSQSLHGQFSSDEEPTFAHLLYGHEKTKPHAYSIKRLSGNMCLVTEPERQVLVGVRPLGQPNNPMVLSPEMQVNCAMFAVGPDEMSFGGLTSFGGEQPMLQTDKPIGLSIDLAQGLVTVKAKEATELILRGLKVAEGTITVAQPTAVTTVQLKAGETQFQADAATGPLAAIAQVVGGIIAVAAERTPAVIETKRPDYAHKLVRQWEFKVPEGESINVRTVESGDLDGDGREEVLVGAADGRTFCLGSDGAQRWEFAAYGDLEHLAGIIRNPGRGINDIAVADLGDGPCVLVASDDEYLYCLDAAGKELWKFTAQGIECTNQAPGTYGTGRYIEGDGEMMVIEVADINADGAKEILVGSKTFRHGRSRVFGTLWCLNSAGELQWHLYQSGGCVTSIAAFDDTGDGQMKIAFDSGGPTYGGRVYLCDNQGNLLNYQGGSGRQPVCDVAKVAPDGSLRLVSLSHTTGRLVVNEVSDPYERKWSYNAGGLAAVGPEVVDLDGDGIAEILIGSGGASLYCLNEAEEPLTWRVNLAEPLSAIGIAQLAGNALQILVGTSMGGIHVVSGDGTPLARTELSGDPITCLTSASLDGEGPESLIVATKGGSLAAFKLQ